MEKEDGRKNNGGVREGSGRKPNLLARAELERVKELISQHGSEIDPKAKKERCLALLDILYQEGYSKRNIIAIKEYLDRQLGKSKQSLDVEGKLSIIGNEVTLQEYDGEESESESE